MLILSALRIGEPPIYLAYLLLFLMMLSSLFAKIFGIVGAKKNIKKSCPKIKFCQDTPVMTIEVKRKEVYGNTLTYVVNEKTRNSIKKLTGRKTLTNYDIEALKELGFVLVIEQATERI